MQKFNSLRLCCGVVFFSLGLSACMDMSQSEPMSDDAPYEQVSTPNRQVVSNKPKAEQKTYASKDPTQKATPGPTRKAAPQIPVIE